MEKQRKRRRGSFLFHRLTFHSLMHGTPGGSMGGRAAALFGPSWVQSLSKVWRMMHWMQLLFVTRALEHILLLHSTWLGCNIFDGGCGALNRAVSCPSGSSSCQALGHRKEEEGMAPIRVFDRNQVELCQVTGAGGHARVGSESAPSYFCWNIKR